MASSLTVKRANAPSIVTKSRFAHGKQKSLPWAFFFDVPVNLEAHSFPSNIEFAMLVLHLLAIGLVDPLSAQAPLRNSREPYLGIWRGLETRISVSGVCWSS